MYQTHRGVAEGGAGLVRGLLERIDGLASTVQIDGAIRPRNSAVQFGRALRPRRTAVQFGGAARRVRTQGTNVTACTLVQAAPEGATGDVVRAWNENVRPINSGFGGMLRVKEPGGLGPTGIESSSAY